MFQTTNQNNFNISHVHRESDDPSISQAPCFARLLLAAQPRWRALSSRKSGKTRRYKDPKGSKSKLRMWNGQRKSQDLRKQTHILYQKRGPNHWGFPPPRACLHHVKHGGNLRCKDFICDGIRLVAVHRTSLPKWIRISRFSRDFLGTS